MGSLQCQLALELRNGCDDVDTNRPPGLAMPIAWVSTFRPISRLARSSALPRAAGRSVRAGRYRERVGSAKIIERGLQLRSVGLRAGRPFGERLIASARMERVKL